MKAFKLLGLAALAATTLTPTLASAQPDRRDGWDRRDDRGRDDRGRGDRDRGDRGRFDGRGDRGGRNDYGWNGDRNGGGWDPRAHYNSDYRGGERRLGRNDRIYRGGDNRYYCRRNDGTTGLVIGALGGGLLGNTLGGNTLGTLLGAGGGALLGRQIDRGGVRCR